MRDRVGEVKMASNLRAILYLLLLSLLTIDMATSAKYKQDQKVFVYNFIEVVYCFILLSFVSLPPSLILFRLSSM